MTFKRPLAGFLLLAPAFAVFSAGCVDPEPVRTYRAPKQFPQEREINLAKLKKLGESESAQQPERRMLAAIAFGNSHAWAFKLEGPADSVAPEVETFFEFMRRVGPRLQEFTGFVALARIQERGDPRPAWAEDVHFYLPPRWSIVPHREWKDSPGAGLRTATLRLQGAKEPLTMTVSRLPLPRRKADGSFDQAQYALMNLNRWRKQLSQKPIDRDELQDHLAQIYPDHGGRVLLFHVTGSPTADQVRGPADSPLPPNHPPVRPQRSLPFAFTAPESWTSTSGVSFSLASFGITTGGGSALVTVSRLPLTNTVPANVARWRGQVGLPAVSEAEIASAVQPVEIGGESAAYVELLGPSDAARREAIFGAILRRDDGTWFFKMRGDVSVVQAERERFREFLHSVKFKRE